MGDPPLPHIASCLGPAVGFPSRRSCDTLSLRPRSKRETGPMPAYEMRAERPIAVGGPSAVWRDEGIACGAGLGTGAGVRPRRRSLPHWGPRRLVRPPQRSQDPGSAALGQSLACQPLPFRWKIGDLPAREVARWRRPRLVANGDPDRDQILAALRQTIAGLPAGAVVLAEDETHINLLPWVRATWITHGQRQQVMTLEPTGGGPSSARSTWPAAGFSTRWPVRPSAPPSRSSSSSCWPPTRPRPSSRWSATT